MTDPADVLEADLGEPTTEEDLGGGGRPDAA